MTEGRPSEKDSRWFPLNSFFNYIILYCLHDPCLVSLHPTRGLAFKGKRARTTCASLSLHLRPRDNLQIHTVLAEASSSHAFQFFERFRCHLVAV